MNCKPDFYLTCTELDVIFAPRACFKKCRLTAQNREDFLLVNVSPPITKICKEEINDIVLATRFTGSALFPINEWPMHVNVCKILNKEIYHTGKANSTDLQIILWGDLFPTIDEANQETNIFIEQTKY